MVLYLDGGAARHTSALHHLRGVSYVSAPHSIEWHAICDRPDCLLYSILLAIMSPMSSSPCTITSLTRVLLLSLSILQHKVAMTTNGNRFDDTHVRRSSPWRDRFIRYLFIQCIHLYRLLSIHSIHPLSICPRLQNIGLHKHTDMAWEIHSTRARPRGTHNISWITDIACVV